MANLPMLRSDGPAQGARQTAEQLRLRLYCSLELVPQQKSALDNNSFMVNGGRLGFPCQVGLAAASV